MRSFLAVLAILLGIGAIVARGAHDSPGLQGLGLLVVVGAAAFVLRPSRRAG